MKFNIFKKKEVKKEEPKKDYKKDDMNKLDEQDTKIIDNDLSIPENMNEKRNPYVKVLQNALMMLSFGIIAWMFVLIPKIQTPDNKTLVNWLVFTGAFALLVLTASILTGTGTEILKRWWHKFRYKGGNYVNDIFWMKSGVAKEVFVKKEDYGAFRVRDKPYVTNPKLSFQYKGMTTYLHKEDTPDPINIWEEKLASDFSSSEMDKVMFSAQNFNMMAWIKKNIMYIFIGLFIIGCLAGAGAYFGQKTVDQLKKGSYTPSNQPTQCFYPNATVQTITILPITQTVSTNNGNGLTTNSGVLT